MLLYIKHKLKWMLAREELEELGRWRLKQDQYRSWLCGFKDVCVVLDNLKAEVNGESSFDASHPPGLEGPWTVDGLRYVLKNKTYLNNKTPIPEHFTQE